MIGGLGILELLIPSFVPQGIVAERSRQIAALIKGPVPDSLLMIHICAFTGLVTFVCVSDYYLVQNKKP